MTRLIVFFVFFSFTTCNSQMKKKNIIEFSCECITVIPEKDDDSELLVEIQNCISESYVTYHEYVDDLANKYFDKNPNAELVDAQNWIRKVLTERLVKECPRFSDFVSNTAFKDRNSTDLVKEISKQVCSEIDNLGDIELSWKVIDPIFVRQMKIYNREINAKYNLRDKEGMDDYSRDLVQELVSTCPKYKEFTLKTNK